MAKLSTIAQAKTQTVIVFGEPKSGKTQLAGDLSKEFDILYFGLENGHATLFKLPPEQQDRIEVVLIPDSRTYPVAIETMLKVVSGNRTEICEEHGKVSCPLCKKDGKPFTVVELNALPATTIVVVDSLTQLAVSAMAHITKSQSDEYKYDWDDYRKQGTLMDKFLSQIQQAKYNVVCITHVTETELEDGRKKLVPVAGTTSFSRNTGKYFGHIVFCEVKNRQHKFASGTTYSNNVLTGSRTDQELENDANPSLLSIFKGEVKTKHTSPSNTAVENLKKILPSQGVKK